jgi:hypothetical protein
MNGSNTYSDRNSVSNRGEVLFEQYCKNEGIFCSRVGFDEKNQKIPRFFNLNSCMKNLPDYYLNIKEKSWLVMVKGTGNIKQDEFELIPKFIEWYSDATSPLIYAFCFSGYTPLLLSPKKVIELYNKSTDKQWSDGKIYRNLNL